MKNFTKTDNYSLVKLILEAIPNGLNSKLKIKDKVALPIINVLGDRLGLDNTETVLFSAIIHSQMTQKKCETSRLAEILNTPIEYIYKNQHSLRSLAYKNAISVNFEYQAIESYCINREVRNRFFGDNVSPCVQKSDYCFFEILDFVNENFGPFKIVSTDSDELRFFREKLKFIMLNNKQLPEIKMLYKTKLGFPEQIILMLMIFNNSLRKGDVSLLSVFDTTTDNVDEAFRLFTSFNSKDNALIKENYIQLSDTENSGPFDYIIGSLGEKFISESFTFTAKELPLPKSELLSVHFPDKTNHTPLYFDEDAAKEYNRISKLFNEENFIKFAGENCITKGLNILFYGTPGTGKTESVMQLAKSSGRIVLQANLSTIRDKWIGASEKNAQKIFDDYTLIAACCKLKPILLLNEADAILGNRQTVTQSADQTNNTMQNIFLECLESFKGILIATTNLQNNLDKAFDRRFLIKMKFQLPSQQKRLEICASKVKDVPVEIHQIISEFEFSGGQLDNISKKIKMYELIDGIKITDDVVRSICLDEQVIKKSNSNKIGF
jgi:DNA polymerase III delta prime subunit